MFVVKAYEALEMPGWAGGPSCMLWSAEVSLLVMGKYELFYASLIMLVPTL
jgi:hypothetical protein